MTSRASTENRIFERFSLREFGIPITFRGEGGLKGLGGEDVSKERLNDKGKNSLRQIRKGRAEGSRL